MGTETNLQNYEDKKYCRKVKLNNPLMGTETPRHFWRILAYHPKSVKLNNPLMGTETVPIPSATLPIPDPS